MGKELWQEERDQLRAVLADLTSGKIRLEQGQDEYLAGLRRRIAHLEAKIAEAGGSGVQASARTAAMPRNKAATDSTTEPSP